MEKDTSIQTLHLSKRSYNVLKKFKIKTIQDLLATSIEDIKGFRGLGDKSVKEILSKIEFLKESNLEDIVISDENIKKISEDRYFINELGEKYNDIPIEYLGISEKSIKFLKNFNIEYYSEILTKIEEIESIEDIEEIIKKEIQEISKKPNIETIMDIKKDIPIDYLGLSVRARNCLKSANIEYYSQLFLKTEQELLTIKNMGIGTVRELQRLNFLIFFYCGLPIANNENKELRKEKLSENSIRLISKIAKLLDCSTDKLISNISDYYFSLFKNSEFISETEYISENIMLILWEDNYGKEKWLKYIIKKISKKNYGMTENMLWENIDILLKDKKIYKKTIEYLFELDMIKNLYDDRIVVNYKSIKGEIYKYLKATEAEIVLKRISGKTLEEIGESLNLTRERIRQIESRGIKRLYFEKFEEDFFLDIFLKYDVNRESFLSVLKEEETYNYLNLRYKNELNQVKNLRRPIEEILEDEELPINIRRNFEKFIYKKYITYGKERILFGRASFIDYLIKHFANEDMSYNDLKEIYDIFLKDLGYENEESLKIVDKSYENRIRDHLNILWKPGRKFRYYNILGYDFSELLEALNLNQYENEEYSSLKFFKMYPNLMESYDIHDEYELHNLLKKICTKNKYSQIKFKRMPSIEFGIVDREQQVKDFLSLLSPISKQDFIKEYEEFYGVDSNSVVVNFLPYIEEYCYGGVYNIKFEEYDESILNDIKNILSEELYTVQEVKEKLKKAFPDYKGELLNPLIIKKLDYKISGGYILKNYYSSAANYFLQLLQKDEIIKLDNISSRIKSSPTFSPQLYKLKEEYEIIEFLPNYFIKFSKLEKLGITKEDLRQYCLDVLSFIGKNKYFTLFSLKKEGFCHKLDDLGFEDYFYTSILIEDRERISYKRIGKNKLMYSSNEGSSFEVFLENIVYQQEKLYIEIYELNDLLKEKYNLQFNISELINSIKNTSMHYDPVSKIVFADYEIYYEVI
ncbi:RNA polymerase subunit sigma [Fusobacterium pseudoperiodonticum]|uniref:DNA-directed RNA polymerase subunit alpha C-terminal domain-containing protein n=1 Tax=Fusobacterium pseudoperiodonticum TaxID=2663009 RepID=UPI000C1C239E|nr:DNA-directed RNA polymerase subunit alpha C-terminal domain-containing protein [Fusobacterium pseudoperiodonticum]ATV68789.1 RNA polymerase subunit sigma [Fusobacterium pseudoperiodonticum]ATV73176.1 RNA polymerase subunit sigma [Fusobacterium pseudoperiodonticum]